MTPLLERSWRLKEHVGPADIEAALAPRFATEWRDADSADTTVTTVTTFFDDADADLWQAGRLLSDSGGEDVHDVQHLQLTRAAAPVAAGVRRRDARFWWAFPEGALREALRPLIGVRALLPVATQTLSRRALVLVNADGKIVLRACLSRSVVDGEELQYLGLQPLRGYDAEHADALRRLRRLLRAEDGVAMHTLLARHHIAAFAPRAAAPMPITDDMPAERAVRAMGHLMLEQAQKEVAGVVDDIDTEFLHNFRVGLRKTRSLVSLMKKTLPPAALDKLKPRLGAMAGATNRLRDLDVYLLAQHAYIALLPADFARGMAELAEVVRTERAEQHAAVAAYFSSPDYRADIDACLAELSLQPALETPAAAKPVLDLVKRQMLRRYAAMRATSALIRQDSADDDIHALRIEFKKLRYLIEFFLDLLPKKRSLKLLGDLKKIQGVLGSFNDLSVQNDFLDAFQDPRRVEMTKALNGLIAILHLKKVAVRERVVAALGDYFTENRGIEFGLVFGADNERKAA